MNKLLEEGDYTRERKALSGCLARLSGGYWLVLTAVLFSLAGLLNGVFAKTFDDISLVPTFVLTPLTYLGGVFYSLTLLPPFWQGLSHLNPIVYMISGFRYGFLGINDVPLVTTFGVLVVFIVAFYLICWSLIQRGRGLRS